MYPHLRSLFFVACLFPVAVLWGQDKETPTRFAAAAVLGMNLSQVDGDGELGFKKPGAVVGASVAYVFHPRWHAGFEMLFSQRGSNDPTDRDGNGQTYFSNYNYVELPIFLKFQDWKATDKKGQTYMKVFAQLGLSYARLFGGKLEKNGVPEPDNFEDYFKKDDLSLFLGAGIWFTRNWGADFRWTNSVVPFTNETTNKQWHRLIAVRAMYQF
jgi:hypothetical protein